MAAQTASPSAPASSLRRKLGRGLGSLISTPVRVEAAPMPRPREEPLQRDSDADPGDGAVAHLALDQIRRNPKQPRQDFDQASLQSLAKSIETSGLMQPIVVRPASSASGSDEAGGFEIIAGERRWRAAQIAGLKRIPAIVREVDDRTAAELSLVENLQREELNPIERAEAFHRLATEFKLTQQEIAARVGLDRSSISNHLRLLELDGGMQALVRRGDLSLGHAKALLGITNVSRRAALAQQAVREQWSVREIERRAQDESTPAPASTAAPGARVEPKAAHPHMADLQRRLAEHLGTKVRITPGRTKGSGRLVIEFYSIDQFEGLMSRLKFSCD